MTNGSMTKMVDMSLAPANDIVRQLVADGVPDAPMQVYSAGLKGCLVWRSFYRAAGYANPAIREIAKALRKHVDRSTLQAIVEELLDARGDKMFREILERIAHELDVKV